MNHFVSESCRGELCGMCYRAGETVPATHKVGEEIPDDTPVPMGYRHNLTQYVCCKHFGEIVGPASARRFTGCEIGIAAVR
jgi:hypothetical protein